MSFWKSLFGGGAVPGQGAGAVTTTKQIDYNGYLIEAQPYAEAGQFQVAGVISKTIDGVTRTYRFVRADRFAGQQDAADVAISKGRQIIDQQGDTIFS